MQQLNMTGNQLRKWGGGGVWLFSLLAMGFSGLLATALFLVGVIFGFMLGVKSGRDGA